MIAAEGETYYFFATNTGVGVRHSMRRHQELSYVAVITAVLSFLVAVTGILDLALTSAQETRPGAVSRTITSSYTAAAEVDGLRHTVSADTALAAENDPGEQPAPSRTEHCPMNLGLTVACPDVLSSAVLASSLPEHPGSTPVADPAAPQAGALPELPATPLHPVSLIRLSISRV